LGDSINLLPIIHAIKKNYPNIEINVLANKYNAQIFEYCSAISHIHILNEKSWLGQNFFFINPLVRKLKKENFDLVIALGGYTSKLAKITYFLKAKYSVGAGSNKFLFDLVYDKAVIIDKTIFKNQIEEMAILIKTARLVIPKNLPYTSLEVSTRSNKNWLAICPDVTKLKIQYPIHQYGEIIKALTKDKRIKKIILLVQSKNTDYIRLAKYGAHLVETRDLHDFIKHLSRCAYAIASEGGSAHIAGALGLSVCVISGTENQIYWRPHANKIKTFANINGTKEISSEIIINGILSFK
jgi:ADP-heptose:LPS heptosyltransferase